jgi:hypothetical protein
MQCKYTDHEWNLKKVFHNTYKERKIKEELTLLKQQSIRILLKDPVHTAQ